MKLTIITINYNNATGLQKTMQSVFSQTSQEFEYVVIDGGSTDGSVDVIKNYETTFDVGQLRITNFRWISEKDNGIYHAMNKGIQKAKGEYVQLVNSGDYLASNDVTEKMIAELKDNVSILYGNMLKIKQDGTIFYNKKIPNISMLTFYRGTINHSCAYIRRDLFDKYGLYDETLKIVSDWKFYLITVGLNNKTVEYVDIDVTCFDMTGISNVNSLLDKQERRQVLTELLPSSILKDYDAHSFDINQMCRIKRYTITKYLFYFIERCLFKYEKMKSKYRREHLFFD